MPWKPAAAVTITTLTACGNSTPTAGTVTGKRVEAGHCESKQECDRRVSGKCRQWKTVKKWDDTDYELQIRSGRGTEWVDVDKDDYDRAVVGAAWRP